MGTDKEIKKGRIPAEDTTTNNSSNNNSSNDYINQVEQNFLQIIVSSLGLRMSDLVNYSTVSIVFLLRHY